MHLAFNFRCPLICDATDISDSTLTVVISKLSLSCNLYMSILQGIQLNTNNANCVFKKKKKKFPHLVLICHSDLYLLINLYARSSLSREKVLFE